MNRLFFRVYKNLIAAFAGISCASFLVAQPSLADPSQSFSTLESDTFGMQSEPYTNPFSGPSSGLDLPSLMHRLNLGPLNWNSEQQNQQLDDAAAAFKARQQKLLQSQQKPNTTSPTTSGENAVPLINLPGSDQ